MKRNIHKIIVMYGRDYTQLRAGLLHNTIFPFIQALARFWSVQERFFYSPACYSFTQAAASWNYIYSPHVITLQIVELCEIL